MAKVKEKEKKQAGEVGYRFPLTRTNFLIIALGVLVIVVGYIFMAIPENSPMAKNSVAISMMYHL